MEALADIRVSKESHTELLCGAKMTIENLVVPNGGIHVILQAVQC